jgi:GT2 family glycosyltransferase
MGTKYPDVACCAAGHCQDYASHEVAPDDVTIAITQWQRPAALKRLLKSLDAFLPGWKVEVEDTGGNLSAGRNRLYGRVSTPFFVVMEEDFVVTTLTAKGLASARRILEYDPSIAGVGGKVREPNRGDVTWRHNFIRNRNSCRLVQSRRPARQTPGGIVYHPCDLVLNWGMFRTSLHRAVPWDPDFAIMEHEEYFWRASQAGFKFAYYPELVIDHLRDRPNAAYKEARYRPLKSQTLRKHGFLFAHGMENNKK